MSATAKQAALCEFSADNGDDCEVCRRKLLRGEHVYWISDGGWEPRDGTYMCGECVDSYLSPPASDEGGQT